MSIEHIPRYTDERVPRGLILVLYVDGQPLLIQTIRYVDIANLELLSMMTDYSIEQAHRWHDEGCEIILRAYDGNDGETMVTVPYGSVPIYG